MAEVTLATGWPKNTFLSNMKQVHYKISAMANTNTLTLRSIGTISAVAVCPVTNLLSLTATNRSGSTQAYLTFTTGGAVTDAFVVVTGH
jgi:hypothetical protein